MENNFQNDKLSLAVNTMYEERRRYATFVMRKEVAAWAAIVVFIAMLGFIISQSNSNPSFSVIFFTVFILVIGCIFFAFIHTQYSSIHACIAGGNAMISTITDLLKKDSFDFTSFVINEEHGTPQCIYDRQQENLARLLPHRGHWHPVKIMWEFVKFRWASSNTEKRKDVKDPVTQEAALYWLLLVLMLFTSLYLWSNDIFYLWINLVKLLF